ncbi:MAG: VanW family protein [Lachnospiraceae bacterium]|nr:VanW family protein [Lachnospiraceae bacterium]
MANRRKRKKSKAPVFLICSLLLIAAGLFFAAGYLLLLDKNSTTVSSTGTSVAQMEAKNYEIQLYDGSQEPFFPKGVSLAGMDLAGKTLSEAKAMAEDYVLARKDRAVTFTVLEVNPYYYNGHMLGVTWENPEIVNEFSSAFCTGNFVEQYTNQKDYEANPKDFPLNLSCDEDYLRSEVATICEAHTSDAVSPTCHVEGGQMVVQAGSIGRVFDVEAVAQECINRVNDYSSTDLVTYDFPCTESHPEFAPDLLSFEWSVLGEYSTNNLGDANRRHNIANSAIEMDGTIVMPGTQASALYNLYGDVSENGGYKAAPTYQNGQQVDDISGGICQTTSTLYNALLRAELKIVYRSKHSMLVSYVPPSLDAMVSTAGGDFIFENNLENPIYIESYVSGDTLVVRIWGKETRPANRTVQYVSELLAIEWPSPLYNVVVDDSKTTYGLVPVGQKIRAEVESHPYVSSRSWKIVYVDGVEQSREILTSDTYKKMTGLMYRASDCLVTSAAPTANSPGGVYPFLGSGYAIHHTVTFLNGEDWSDTEPDGNYGS